LEEKYVTLELIESDEKCLNLMAGGYGSSRTTEETRKKLSLVTSGKNNGMYGKKHTEATRQKITSALLGKPLKEETKKIISVIFSNRIWVNNGSKNKRIEKNELQKYIKKGFREGRTDFSTELKQKISVGVSKLTWVNNGKQTLRIKSEMLNHFIENGYAKGRGKINFKKDVTNG
jgi:hypothetical protein